MNQKLLQHLISIRNHAAVQSCQSISPGIDIKYECGRRIGVTQGMDVLLKAITEWNNDTDSKDKEL